MYKEDFLNEIDQLNRRYEEEFSRILDRIPNSKKHYITNSGIKVKPLYTPSDIAGIDLKKDLSYPGQYPYTRGIFPAGYLSRPGNPFNMRQVTGIGTAEETNKRWKYLFSLGARAVAVVGAPHGWSPDVDDEMTLGFAGKDSLAADTLADMETLFDGIDLRKISVHLISGSTTTLAMYIAIAEKQDIDPRELRGSMSNSLRPDRDCIEIIEYCHKNMPLFHSGYIDVRNVREAGCNAVQEIAFGCAMGMAAVEAVAPKGIGVDEIAPRISWFVNSCPDFFEEIAKFRAMRKVWARTMRERCNAKNPKSWQWRAHCQTYAPTLTGQQPFNNIIRSTIYALPAIIGGVQSLHVNSFDETLACPTEFSVQLSLKTMQIIAHETGITSVIDPIAGSYYVEWLTKKLEEEAEVLIDTINAKGGAYEAWTWMEDEVRKEASINQREFDKGNDILIGVNAFAEEVDLQMQAFETLQEHAEFEALYVYDPSIRDKQIARLNKFRQERDHKRVEEAKKILYDAFKSTENAVPALVKAVKMGVTQGEIYSVRKEAEGKDQELGMYMLG
ncbi:MAG: methylmalonyl-CoA mutase family protein [Thermodesulfobacteriota bacterium]|nr:methylmalonyl-CoA mutase family protein [Thermodesulfobacteriota bacterium]